MKTAGSHVGKNNHRIRIEKPAMQGPEEEQLLQEMRKFAKLVPYEPEPNMGRVREIKEEIMNGTYITPEVIEETAARLAIRFMRKE